MLRLDRRPPAPLSLQSRDFAAGLASHQQHVKDSGFLLLMVIGYLLALAGGIVLLGLLTPVSHSTSIVSADRSNWTGVARSNP